jgi:aldehyde dehydrogenase (NAD+)
MSEIIGNYIDGDWIDGRTGETFENRNPATGEYLGSFKRSSRDDANDAVAAAVSARDEWATTPGPSRGETLRRAAALLEDRKDELTETLVSEEGKTPAEAAPEVQRAVDIFYYYAEKACDLGGTVKSASARRTTLRTKTEAIGTVALITPWNYPIAIPAWKIAPALATGNTLVLKPASQAPDVARKLFECLDDAGLPAGVANFVTGTGAEVGDELVRHEEVDAVSFTGSAEVGEQIRRGATGNTKRIQLEMGGKNPVVVTRSADVEEAVDIVSAGGFGVTGQACTATSRAIVHESLYDTFVDQISESAEAITVGPGFEAVDMGPQVSESELQTTLDYIEVGIKEGATLKTGGTRVTSDVPEAGYFVEPTVFTDVDPDMRIAQEEIFGPVLSVIGVSDFAEAIEVANDSRYGLSAGIVSDDHTEINRFIDEVDAGVVKINEKTTGLELHVPFGGVKQSSSETWREQGDAGIEFFTISKTIYDNY